MKARRLLIIALSFAMCICLIGCAPDNTDEVLPPIDDRALLGELSGVVVENDKPLAQVVVKSGKETAMTDQDGHYSIKIYDDGLKVVFTKSGYITQEKTVKKSTFNQGKGVYNFSIFRAVRVFGKVTDNGEAVANAVVCIGIQTTTTNAQGEYVFEQVIGTTMILTVSSGTRRGKKILYFEMMQQAETQADVEIK